MIQNFGFWDFGGPFALIIVLFFLAVLAFEVWMIINAIQNKYIEQNTRILWVIGMLIIHPFVAIAYYFTDYKKTL